MNKRKFRCWYCGHLLFNTSPTRDRSKTRDHVHPKSLGGTRTVKACRLCNIEKRDMTLAEYRELKGGRMFYGEGGPLIPGDLR